jgi:nucleotide-binding universal stress UspA family protein
VLIAIAGHSPSMTINAIISYDDTANDRDALALGRLFADAGASVDLAYVVHGNRPDSKDEQHAATLLERGALSAGLDSAKRHVVRHGSTAEGLWDLARETGADLVVFGTDYRTPRGSLRAGPSAQRLMNGGPAAVAIAPSGLRDEPAVTVGRIRVLADAGDEATETTARSLAAALGATVVEPGEGRGDLLVIGSRAEAPSGRVMLSAAAEYALETATGPALVLPRDVALEFAAVPAPA